MESHQSVSKFGLLMALIAFTSGSIGTLGDDWQWNKAHATFYGDMEGGETLQGACGYDNVIKQGYGLATAALSTALFNNGATCGACFEIYCVDSPWCIKNAGSIQVTATNFCPPNYTKTHDIWCNPPQKHFDLSMPMFLKIAAYKAGIVPVSFRRVVCQKRGGIQFELKGNPNFLLVLVFNVGGTGEVAGMKVKGSKTNWLTMTRNWGQNWQTGVPLQGQSLSFQVTASDGKIVEADFVAPPNWQFGQTYQSSKNFW
ncbi:expansin-A23-like [Cornus florida]|uniref:expansin-A23-like n=1 Tax=Cornus florida TaxID=4283 RepID=UPI0028A1E418|nr:expansin-A23-like [Cornus florida]